MFDNESLKQWRQVKHLAMMWSAVIMKLVVVGWTMNDVENAMRSCDYERGRWCLGACEGVRTQFLPTGPGPRFVRLVAMPASDSPSNGLFLFDSQLSPFIPLISMIGCPTIEWMDGTTGCEAVCVPRPVANSAFAIFARPKRLKWSHEPPSPTEPP